MRSLHLPCGINDRTGSNDKAISFFKRVTVFVLLVAEWKILGDGEFNSVCVDGIHIRSIERQWRRRIELWYPIGTVQPPEHERPRADILIRSLLMHDLYTKIRNRSLPVWDNPVVLLKVKTEYSIICRERSSKIPGRWPHNQIYWIPYFVQNLFQPLLTLNEIKTQQTFLRLEIWTFLSFRIISGCRDVKSRLQVNTLFLMVG